MYIEPGYTYIQLYIGVSRLYIYSSIHLDELIHTYMPYINTPIYVS